MFKKAIVLINNNQYLIYNNEYTYINKLKYNKDTIFYIDKILLIVDNLNKMKIGNPFLKSFIIKALVIDHIKNNKIIIFKKKKRKGYNIKKGYRQILTKIKILDIKIIKKNGT
ncbi:MAG: 50S ribosomal protein L21 [Candidatus Shikimatogenerans sp. JK-2022]|nr:50S ribosomal protein L21 [Candidatus Shikimatogenerans bostrichidophilus]